MKRIRIGLFIFIFFHIFHILAIAQLIPQTLGREQYSNYILSVAFSPNGELLATASSDSRIRVWNVSLQKEVAFLKGHSSAVNSVAFSPDGEIIASASDDATIKLWNISKQTELATLKGHAKGVNSIAFSPDGKTLVSGSSDETLKLWDVTSRKEISTLKGHSDAVYSVAFSKDGKLIASAGGLFDRSIKLWDTTTRKEIATLKGHNGSVRSVAFSQDGTFLASGSSDKSVKLWDISLQREVASLKGHSVAVLSVAFSKDDKFLASASDDRNVKVWDTSTQSEIATFTGHTGFVNSVDFSPNSNLLASGSSDETAKLWDLSLKKEVATLKSPIESVISLALDSQSQLFAAGMTNGNITIWEASSQSEVSSFKAHSGSVTALAFASDGRSLLSGGDDGIIKVWDWSKRRELSSRKAHSGAVSSISVSPDSSIFITASNNPSDLSDYGTIKFWDALDLLNLRPIAILKAHNLAIKSLKFSSDGRLIASASDDRSVKVWDAFSRVEVANFRGHLGSVNSVAFSPDNKLLASASSDSTVRLWDLSNRNAQNTQSAMATFRGHTDVIRAVEFSKNGEYVASSSSDNSTIIWEVASQKELAVLKGHIASVNALAFTADGKALISGSDDRTIKIWQPDIEAKVEWTEPSGSYVNSPELFFRWQPIPVLAYQVQAAKDDKFTELLADILTARPETPFSQSSKTTYWRLRGVGFNGFGEWQGPWKIATELAIVKFDIAKIVGSEATVDVKIEEAKKVSLYRFDLKFDPQYLEAAEVKRGTFLAGVWNPPQMDNKAGVIKSIGSSLLNPFFGGGKSEIDGSGTLATIRFKIKKPGSSKLKIENLTITDLVGNKHTILINDGQLETTGLTVLRIRPTVDQELVLEILVENVKQLHDFWLDLAVDLRAFEVTEISQGDFLTQDGAQISIKKPSEDKSILAILGIGAWRNIETGIDGSGVLARLRLRIWDGGTFSFKILKSRFNDASGKEIELLLGDSEVSLVKPPSWDVNRDYIVDIFDFVILSDNFGKKIQTPFRINPDVNGDGIVDILDFVEVGSHFGEVYSALAKLPAASPPAKTDWERSYPEHLEALTKLYLNILTAPFDNFDHDFLKAKAILQRLILLAGGKVSPLKNQLHQNFPNPFNPETWIPYELSEDAEVSIRIYDISGKLVKSLNLGRQSAGYYLTKGKAAHWDGKNQSGEQVASGLYFYSIKIDKAESSSFAAIKRMILVK